MTNRTNVTNPAAAARRRLGGWLPADEAALARYRKMLVAHARERATGAPTTGAVRELAMLVEGEPSLRMALACAIGEARSGGYELGYETIDELMAVIDFVMTYAPPFSESGLVVCPLNALLDWPLCMPSGYAFFRDRAVNAQLKRVLNVWCGFLSGPHSRAHLNASEPDGWFCAEAVKRIGMSQFHCDPQLPYWGFSSWNDFFTRRFLPDVRPVASPDDPAVVVSACEAAPYHVAHDLKLLDTFWLKSQPYSLRDIFTAQRGELAQHFVGGSLYQAFLSAYDFHRWHAPVAGRIAQAYLVDGTYYSSTEAEGADPAGLNDSQGYMTAVATRAVIIIDADSPAIGRVACVFVGMGEVSSCVIDALPAQRVKKGEEIGYFQYGGSTYCMIFEPDVIGGFVAHSPYREGASPVHVNAEVAAVAAK
ncbi:phosphatidylserine decarboxylase family protein [Burkholderia mayonis]|uniref:Phosphatidylserine decarboxylase n=1 Tax=Burkholderia mayonis TaxID=1385591 RepID=A0A1B4FW32_9BURK|nr:phosphatidylserine decarboxylase family protein [Burkholderia mayonis]AOJ07903.1 phosphatidylserine decarboxylase [Burkholderia mayonis]KVE55407.1 phosphatidylserine decarboxylase [Burkholderia mayonis]